MAWLTCNVGQKMTARSLVFLTVGIALSIFLHFAPTIIERLSPKVEEDEQDQFEKTCVELNTKDGRLQLSSFVDGEIYRNSNERLWWKRNPEGYVIYDVVEGKEIIVGRVVPTRVIRYFKWYPAGSSQTPVLMKSSWGRVDELQPANRWPQTQQ